MVWLVLNVLLGVLLQVVRLLVRMMRPMMWLRNWFPLLFVLRWMLTMARWLRMMLLWRLTVRRCWPCLLSAGSGLKWIGADTVRTWTGSQKDPSVWWPVSGTSGARLVSSGTTTASGCVVPSCLF